MEGEKHMTKDQLEQYPDLCAEIQELTEQLRRGVSDTVSASSTEYPYTQHPVTIQGTPPELHARLAGLKKQKAEIEAFVAGLPNSTYRRVADFRGLQGEDWKTVAAKMGHRYSVEKAKRKYYEIFSKNRTF